MADDFFDENPDREFVTAGDQDTGDGYDPAVSGRWSDTDEAPYIRKPTVPQTREQRAAELAEQKRVWDARVESALKEWDGFYAKDAAKDPYAFQVARALTAIMSPWCGNEECGIGPEDIRAALTACELDVVKPG